MNALRTLFALAALVAVAPAQAAGSGVSFGPHDVRSVFHVRKSENQNQVHYGVRLDAACRPIGPQPVFGYWRRLKGGTRVDEPLVSPGTRVYGPSDEQTVTTTERGSRVRMFVKALERLQIDVDVEKTPRGCEAVAHVTLRGSRARLSHAFLQLGAMGLRVKHVDVVGQRTRDGAELTERFR